MRSLNADGLLGERLLSPVEVSEVLNVSVGTLSNWRVSGRYDLPYIKVGSRVRYMESSLRRFLLERSVAHTSQPLE